MEEYRIEQHPIPGDGKEPIFDDFKSEIFPTLPEDVQEEIINKRRMFQRLEGIISSPAARQHYLGSPNFHQPGDKYKFESDFRRVSNSRMHLEKKYGLLQEAKEHYTNKVRALKQM